MSIEKQSPTFSNTCHVLVFLALFACFTVSATPSGQFRVPVNGQTFNGNIMFGGSVTDADGSGSLIIRIAGASDIISLCSNCFGDGSTPYNFVRAGINPRSLGLSNGNHSAQLIEIDNNSETIVDSVNFNWTPPQVSGINVTRTLGSISVSWNGVSGYNRYNLYIASEPNITPDTINNLPDRTTFRGLNGTSQTITGYTDGLGLFGLVTATNNSGEGAYSEVFRIEALDNQDPTVVSEEFSLDEDTSIQGNILDNDTDPEGEPVTAELVAQPVSGSATLDAQGNFSYTPNSNFNGTDSFNYTVSDPQGGSGLGSVTFTVDPVNDDPVVSDDSYETAEDALLSISAAQGLLVNDTDIDNDPLQATLITQAGNGAVTISPDGAFTYQPDAKYFGVDSFQYLLSDGQGGEQIGNVTINVLQVNDLPVANDDQYETGEDTPLVLNVTSGVLANDTDEDAFNGDIAGELTVSLLTDTVNGALSLATNGSFSYTPNDDFFGSDSFGYMVTDSGGQTDTATAFINVVSINDPPNAIEDTYETAEDTQLTIDATLGVLANDSDIEDSNNLLTASLLTTSNNGVLQLNTDGSFTYQPEPDFFGTDSFTYQVLDSEQLASEQTVSISVLAVNDAPVATDDQYELEEDQTFAITDVTAGLLANDADPDLPGDARFSGLTVSPVTPPDSGQLSLEANGTFSYVPEDNFFGQVAFVYQINDVEGETSQASVTLNITDVPDVPLPADDTYSTAEEVTLEISATAGVLANDIDTSGTALTVTLLESTQSGILSLNSDGSFTYQPDVDFFGDDGFTYQVTNEFQLSAVGSVSLAVTPVNDAPVAEPDEISVNEGTTIEIKPVENDTDPDGDTLSLISADPQLGSLSIDGNTITYVAPEATLGQNTTDTITYTIADEANVSATGTITVTVINVNNAPEAQDDSAETAEDTPVTIAPLENDSDADGDELNLTVDSVSNGEAEVSGNNVIYSPADDFNGTAQIGYTISDSDGATASATITIIVTPVNDPPVAQDDSFSINEGATISFSPLENDTDIEDTELTIVSVSAISGTASHNGSEIEYTAPLTPGSDTITYSISDSDGGTDSAVINVTISDINIAPVANNDEVSTNEDTEVTINVLANDSDSDGDSLTIAVTNVQNGTATVSESNAIIYSPPQNYFGEDKIDYTVTDPSGATDNAEVSISVLSVNDPPVAVDDIASVDEGQDVTINVLNNDTDIEGSTLTISSATPSIGTVGISADQSSLVYTAPIGFTGNATIAYFISDGEANSINPGTVTVTVHNFNFTPDAVNDSASTNEDTQTTINVLANDSDIDGDSLTVSINSVQHGTATVSEGNAIVYVPPQDFFGEDKIDYSVSDPGSASDNAEVLITVVSVNDAPVAVNDIATVDEGQSITINVLENDTDVEGSALKISSATPSTGTVNIATDETTLTYTAPVGFAGNATISYFITDGEATSENAGTVTVTVNDINFTPVAVADSFNVNAGETNDFDILSNDTDTDGDALTITSATPLLGTVSISTDAKTISYTAPSDTTATDTINYTISDPSGATASSTATVNITELAFSGSFDSDGDGNSDVSTTPDGTDYIVTFGDRVDAVYYEENGEFVSISSNDSGVFELTIQGTGTANKKPRTKTLRSGIKVALANRNFVLPNTTNKVFYIIAGTEYSFTVTNLDQPSANIAFGPPEKLDSDFGGAISHDFFLRHESFTGPLRLGVTNGEHYILDSDGSGFIQGSNFNVDVSWQDINGAIEITAIGTREETLFLNVFDLDDDASDGIALNVITRAEADAYVVANDTVFVEVFSTDVSQTIRLINDNKVYIDAQIERYASYRIDSTSNPEITSANDGVVVLQPVEVTERQLWDIENLKIQDISFPDLAAGIATDIPRIQDNEFDSIVADICSFTEDTNNPNSGTGHCEFNDQPFGWQINNRILSLDFGNDVIADYRWIDRLAVENTFAIEVITGAGTSEARYSVHAYWLKLENLTDTMISSLVSGHYFDSALTKTNPDARDSNNNINTGDIFGFYFDASGLAKNLLSFHQFTGDQLFDTDQKWALNNGDMEIVSLSSISSPNATFRYFYDQCTNTADEDCFAWEVREWHPITIDDGKLWVWETVIQNQEGPNFDGSIDYFEQTPPRILFYEFNSTIPGAPNSISFNQEPNWQSPDLTTEINTPLQNIDLTVYFSDPESDVITVEDVFVDTGSIQLNSDNTVTFTPETDFSGNVNLSFSVTDGTNVVFAFGNIRVLSQNVPPVAVDDTANASSGFLTIISPLDNDSDQNDDDLFISSVSAANGSAVITPDQTEIEYLSGASFTGPDTLTYTVEDGRGGSDTGTINVTVSQPQFTGSYDLDNSGDADFTISTDGTDFNVLFGDEVDAVFYAENGQIIAVAQNADGSFEFQYDGSSSTIALLNYVIDGVQYTISPDNLTATPPNLIFGGTTDLINDFGSRSDYDLIGRSPVTKAALSTGFENGVKYSLISNGTGVYSSPSIYDTVTWSQNNGILTVSFDNPTEQVVFFNVYDLDDEDNNDGSLGIITKAEADAYFAANNNTFIDVYVSTTSHEISVFQNNGYFYESFVTLNQTIRIDSTSHPEITSANNGVPTNIGGNQLDLMDTSEFDFMGIETSRIIGQVYLPIPIDHGAGDFSHFMSDSCSLSENSRGSNFGSGSCSLSGISMTWLINSDGSLDVTVVSTSGLSASYHGFTQGNVEDTVFVEATDINGHKFSTLDYWFEAASLSSSDVSSLLSNNYMETSDNITNPFNYDSDGILNDDIGNGFYFDNSGLAKELRTSIDAIDNDIIVDDSDRQWNVSSSATVDIVALSNLSSGDTFQYQYSQCSNSNDQECYIWAFKNWQPLAIDGNRIWVLDSDFDDSSSGFFGGLPISYDLVGTPRIRFYDVRSDIPGSPNSINFNQNPVMLSHDFNAAANAPTNFDLLSVIGDPEGDPVSLIDAQVEDGSIIVNSDSSVTYTPPTNFSGTTFFDIQVSDGINEVSLHSFISVAGPNNPPVAVDDTDFAIGGHSYTYFVLDNDSDGDGDPLTITELTTISSGFSIAADNISINYNAPASTTATPTVTYTVSDGNGGTDTAVLTVNLTPNNAPVAQADSGVVTAGSTVTLFPLDNDFDVDGDFLSIDSASSSDGSTFVASDGQSFDFTPSITGGTAAITYIVSDGFGGSDTGSVSVTVNAVNSPPVANSDTENAVGSHTYVFNVLSNDTDGDGDTLTITNLATTATGFSIGSGNTTIDYNAPASLTATPTITYTISDGNGGSDTAVLTVNLTPNSSPNTQNDSSSVNAGATVTISPLTNDSDPDGDAIEIGSASSSDGSVVIAANKQSLDFTPTITSGTATISYSAADQFGGSSNGSISVTVNAVNTPPVANNDTENAVGSHTYVFNVLSNDTDGDGDTLTITNLATTATGFTIGSGNTTINYNAPASLAATPTVTYTISDGKGGSDTAVLTVNLTPNSSPNTQNDSSSVNAGATVTISPLTNDSDPDGDAIEIGSASSSDGAVVIAANKQSLDFTPTITSGTATISYSATDQFGGSSNGSISVTVNVVNTPPVANNDTENAVGGHSYVFNVLSNDSDSDGGTLTITNISTTDSGFSIGSGSTNINYLAPASSTATPSVTYTISDGQGGSDSAVLNVNLTPNGSPSVQNDSSSVNAGSTVTISPLTNDSDPDGDAIEIGSASSSDGSVVIAANKQSLDFTPTITSGTATISYSAADQFGGSSNGSISVTVNAVNTPPVANNDTENAVGSHAYVFNVLSNDTDGDGDTLTITSLVTLATGFSVGQGNTTINYNAPASLAATPTVTYTISDGKGGSDTAVLTVNLTPNSSPNTQNDSSSVNAGATVTISPLTNDSDPDGDVIEIGSASSSDGSVVIAANKQSLDFTPTITSGTATISYSAADQFGGSSNGSISVTVNVVNTPPVANNDTENAVGGHSYLFNVLSNDSDSDGGTLTITNISTTDSGFSIDSRSTSINYLAPASSTATPSVTYTISDGQGGSDSAVLNVNLTPNSSPSVQNDSSSVNAGSTVTISPLSNDSDPNGDAIEIGSASSSDGSVVVAVNKQSLDFTPTITSGTATVSYSAVDQFGGSSNGSISVSVNAIPVAVNDTLNTTPSTMINFDPRTNDTDADSDPLTIQSASAVNGSVTLGSGNLSLDYTSPSTGHTDTISYVISDGKGGQDTGQVTVNVNTNPVASVSAEVVGPSSVTALTPSISDADGDSFTVTAASTSTGSVTFSGTNINYTAPSTETSASISYSVSDGFGGTASSTINVTINHVPVGNADSYTLSRNGTTDQFTNFIYVPTASGVISNDTDSSTGDSHTATVVTAPTYASAFTLNSDGSFKYQHNGTANYSDSFTYNLSDGAHTVGPITASLTIVKENWKPRVCTFPRRYIQGGEVLSQEIRIADFDGDAQSFNISGNPSWMQINIDSGDNKKAFITSTETGGIVPTSAIGSTYNLTVTSSDGYESVSRSFDMTVTAQFGTANVFEQAFGGTVERVHDATIDSSGRIVYVGSSDGDVAIGRVLPGGLFDPNFNSGTPVIIDVGGTNDVAMAVTTTPTGAIYAAGSTNADTDADSLIIALNENGSLNSGFNGGNIDGGTRDAAGIEVKSDNTIPFEDVIEDIHYLDTGHLLVVGQSDNGVTTDLFVGQYNITGAVNTSWDAGDGFISITGATKLIPRKSRISKEGALYIVGDALNVSAQDIFITRVKMNGVGLDTSFNGGSIYYLDDSSGNEEANDFVFDVNGNLIIAGKHNSDLALYYRALSGTNDTTISAPASFNSGTDKLVVDLNSGSTDEAYNIVSDKRGNYYVAAKSNADTKAIKISADGTQDTGYGTGGIKTISLTHGDTAAETIMLRDARGQLLFIDVEDPGSDDHIQLTTDFILTPPVFGSCPSTGSEVAKTSTSSSDKSDDTTVAISQYADGRYYVVGYSIPDRTTSRKRFAAVRVLNDGSIDGSFSDGFNTVDGGSVSSIRAREAITVENNNLIITGFNNAATFEFFMAKLTASGDLDTSFDSDGRRDFGGALKLQPAGMLYDSATNDFLVAGKSDSGKAYIYRFNSDASDDNNFGAGSTALSSADTGVNYTAYPDANFITSAVFQLADTNIYQVGQLFVSDQEVAVMQLDSNGLLQTSYGTSGSSGGIRHYSESGTQNVIASVDTDGTHFYVLNHNNGGDSATARIFKVVASTGLLDDSYGVNGIATISLPDPNTGTLVSSKFDSGHSWTIQVDGSGNQWVLLYADSSLDTVNSISDEPYLVKLKSNGSFDASFANGGYTRLTHSIANWSDVTGFELDSANNAFIYGYSGSDFYFALAGSNGVINSQTPVSSLDLGDGSHNFDIALDEYSGVNLAGASFNNSDLDAKRSLTRFDNSGNADTSFGSLGSNTAIETFSVYTNEISQFNAITASPMGNLYHSGSSFPEGASSDTDLFIGRSAIAGATLDVTGYPGLSNINNTTGIEAVGSQYLADDGSLFIAGRTGNLASVYKYDYGGSLSTTFNASSTTGFIHLIETGSHQFNDIKPDGKGGFIAVGYITNGGHDSGLIARFTDSTTTALDSGFDGNGVATYDVSSNNERFQSVSIGTDGTIYAVGYSNYKALVVAYDSTGSLVNKFSSGTASHLQLDFTGGTSFSGTENIGIQTIVDIERDAYGGLMVLARVENGFTLARYKSDGTLITNYGGLHKVSHANKLRALTIDSLGNVYLTGSAQIEARWVSFVVRFPNAIGPL